MEWEAPGIVLSVRPFGEGDAIAATFTELHGRHLGLARGGMSRRQAAVWQAGNLVQLRWTGRLVDQLGGFSGELVHATAALAMDDPLALALLTASCGIADGVLSERAPHPRAFAALLSMLAILGDPRAALAAYVRWEVALLAELGFGLDMSRCAVTGGTQDLAFISPRTGRAVSRNAAGAWRERLLVLPRFVVDDDSAADLCDVHDGLKLTGHFLARMVFAPRELPLPASRAALLDRVAALAAPG